MASRAMILRHVTVDSADPYELGRSGPPSPGVPGLLFIRVPETKSVKNRLHTGWVTLQDPEGNEFCIERSAAERAT